MARKFYLSFVYDLNGYDRFDILSSNSLKEIDNILANFKNRNEVLDKYFKDYNIDRKKGKVCIVYEDTDIKKREIKAHGLPEDHSKEDIERLYTYSHIIPVMYQNEKLMSIDSCLYILKYKLFDPEVIKAITQDLITNNKQVISINKKYIFEIDEEADLVNNESKYREALDLFYKRLKKSNIDDQYFYCRTLVNICGLSYKIKKKVSNLKVNKDKLDKILKTAELTETEKLEQDANDMETFYLKHDLDDVINLSPDKDRPIGSVGKGKK